MAPLQLEENDEQTQQYPFKYPSNLLLPAKFDDIYQREPYTLVASLARFGHAVQSREAALPDAMNIHGIIPTFTRLCEDEMTISDLQVLLDKFPLPVRTKRVFFASRPDRTTLQSIGDIRQYDQILSYYAIDSAKWIILLVLPEHRCIEVYTIGDIEINPLKVVLSNQQNLYYLLSSGTSFGFKLRLKVPQSFAKDPIWMVYVLLDFLHHNGNYLDLTMDKVMHKKLSMLHDMVLCHDQWLGKLHVETSFPFVSTEYHNSKSEQEFNAPLKKLGWIVIDVCGDGNCGYYATILGLENIGFFQYSVTSKWSRTRVSTIPMPRNPAWQYHVIKLRSDLQRHSQYLLEEVYPPGQRNHEWLLLTGATTDRHFAELSCDFLNPNLLQIDYFNGSLRDDENVTLQMNPYWASFVLASMLRIRVIVYTRNASWNGVQVTYTWSTTISVHNHDTAENGIKQYEELVRLSDIEFKKIPTIEMVYTTGFIENGFPESNHIRWLRRVICHNVSPREQSTKLTTQRLSQLLNTNIQRINKTPLRITNSGPPNPQNETPRNSPTPLANNESPSPQGHPMTKSPVGRPTTSITNRGEKQLQTLVTKKRKKRTGTTGGKQCNNKSKKQKESWKKPSEPAQTRDAELLALTQSFNDEFANGTSKHGTATQMYYFANTRTFSIRVVDENGQFSFPTACKSVAEYDDKLVEAARKYAGTWVGPSIGDAGNGTAPDYLNTIEKTIYQQHGNRYCLAYSLASALFYCEFPLAAEWIATAAQPISELSHDQAISKIRELMANAIPQIGLATLYGFRTKTSCRIKRKMTWEKLFTEITPFPTLVIPSLPNGATTHAFCVVDDLIFDSITPYALKLCAESVRWIFNDSPTSIYQVLRFNTKVSPKGHKVKGKYTRKIVFHWDNPAQNLPVPEKSLCPIP